MLAPALLTVASPTDYQGFQDSLKKYPDYCSKDTLVCSGENLNE